MKTSNVRPLRLLAAALPSGADGLCCLPSCREIGLLCHGAPWVLPTTETTK